MSAYLHFGFDLIAFSCLKRLEQLLVDSLISVESSLSMPIEFYLFILQIYTQITVIIKPIIITNIRSKCKPSSHLIISLFLHKINRDYFQGSDFQLYFDKYIQGMITQEVPPQAPSQEDIQKRKKIEKEVTKTIKEIVEQVQFVLSSGPHHDYFLGKEDKKIKLKVVNAKYNNLIQSKLLYEIQTGQTKISKHKTSYINQPKAQPKIQDIAEINKNQIKIKKKHAIEALNEVLKQQNQLIKQQNSMLKVSRSLVKHQVNVQENPQWRSQLAQAIKRKRQLDRSLEIKSQQADHKVIQIKEQAIKAKKQKLERQRQNHIKLAQNKRQRQSMMKLKELQLKAKCEQFVQTHKPIKYQFEVMSQRGLHSLKAIQQERQQKIRQYKQMRQRHDWSQLKEHQEKYFQALSQRKQQWTRKFEQSLSQVSQRHQKSIFAEKIKQEEMEKQLQERLRKNKKKQFLQKIKEYGASVLQNHMPRKFMKSSKQLTKDDNKSTRQSLNRMQQRQKGLTYLTQAKKHRKLNNEKTDSLKVASSLPTIKGPVYKDYLKEQPKRLKQRSSFYTVLSQKKGEWASNAKSILQKMDINHKSGDKMLLQSAFKKIELLNAII